MTDTYIHVIFSCAHSALVPVHLYEQSLANNTVPDISQYLLSDNPSLADPAEKTITSHVSHTGPCGRDTCYNISTPNLQHQILARIDNIRSTLADFQSTYTALGTRYHTSPLSLRAQYSNDPACAMSHLQFGITTQSWDQDAFFEPWLKISSLCSDIQRRVCSPCFDTGSKNVGKVGKLFVICNETFDEVAQLLGMLKLGLDVLEKAQRQRDSRIVIYDLPTDSEEREAIQKCLKDARVAKEKNLNVLTTSDATDSVVVKCNSSSQALRVRKLLKQFQAYGVSVSKFPSPAGAAGQQSPFPSKERRFAAKDSTRMRKLAFKNVLKSIWGERMSGFVNLAKSGGQPWWVLS